MLSLIHYISAIRRLDECNKTILMLDGSLYHDDGIPPQIAAQREMIKKEIEYYGEQTSLFFKLFFCFIIILIAVSIMLIQFGVFK